MDKIRKKYLYLLIIVITGIIVGIIFANILSDDDSKLVYSKITTYFNNIKNDVPINYFKNLITSIKNNYLLLITIWILGLSIIGLLFNNFILFFKSFVLGFSIGSIINIYFYSGIVLSFFYVFPSILINLLVIIIMTYYANIFSFKLFDILFRKKDLKFTSLMKKYSKILGLFSIILGISSIIETFIMPFFLKLFSFLIK